MFATPIHHAAILVSNLENSLHFYRDILEWKVLFSDTLSIANMGELLQLPSGVEGRTVMLQKDNGVVNGMIELMEITKPKPEPSQKGEGFRITGLRMLSFRVDDVDKAYNTLVDKGVNFISPPKKLIWDKYCLKACMFTDPDNVLIEVMEFLAASKK